MNRCRYKDQDWGKDRNPDSDEAAMRTRQENTDREKNIKNGTVRDNKIKENNDKVNRREFEHKQRQYQGQKQARSGKETRIEA